MKIRYEALNLFFVLRGLSFSILLVIPGLLEMVEI